MLGHFYHSPKPDPASVCIQMRLDDQGSRMASIVVPITAREILVEKQFPSIADAAEMRIEAAVSYGIYIAMLTYIPLVIVGDSDIWDERWGALIDREKGALQIPRTKH